MNITSINNNSFGIAISPKAINELTKAGFCEPYIELLRHHGSPKTTLANMHKLSLPIGYKTSCHIDGWLPLDSMDKVFKEKEELLIKNLMQKAFKKNTLNSTSRNILKDYPEHATFIKETTEHITHANSESKRNPIIKALLDFFG